MYRYMDDILEKTQLILVINVLYILINLKPIWLILKFYLKY